LLKGYFKEGKPFIKVKFRGYRRQIEALVDTGFTGCFALPEKTIKKMKLGSMGEGKFVTIRGKYTIIKLYLARVNWFGKIEKATVLATKGTHCLIGMYLLRDYKFTMQPSRNQLTICRPIRK